MIRAYVLKGVFMIPNYDHNDKITHVLKSTLQWEQTLGRDCIP